MIRRSRLPALLAALVLLVAGCAHELRNDAGVSRGLPIDINDHDTILGVAYNGTVPFAILLSGPGGASRQINGPGGTGFLPRAFNDDDVIAGETVTGEGYQQIHRAAIWSAGDGFTILPLPPGTFQSTASDINSDGTVAFNAYSPSGATEDGAYLWHRGSAPTRLPDPPGASNGRASYAEAINDQGVVVGSAGYGSRAGIGRAVRWAAGTHAVSFLGAADVNSTALDVNERGTAVGGTGVGTPGHAAAWLAGGALIDLGPGIAEAVNDLELAVGQSGSPPRAVLWSTATRVRIALGTLGTASNAVALNNVSRAVGDSDGRPAEYSLP